MTKLLVKRRVIELRKQGKSYSDILKIVKVSKSSLSLWLKDVPLTPIQKSCLADRRKRAVETYRATMKLKHQNKLDTYYKGQAEKLLPLSEKELMIAGLFLYSGEGNKVSTNALSVANTDPSVIRFCFCWMKKSLGISEDKIFLKLHLYNDRGIKEESNYWAKFTGVKISQFKNPYIKKSFRSDIDQKGFGHGTCTIMVFNTVIKENVMMAIKAVSDSYVKI